MGSLTVARQALRGQLPERYAPGLRGPFDAAARPLLAHGAAVLDVGAGRHPTYVPAERPGVTYVGLDMSASELAAAPPGSYDETHVADVGEIVPGLVSRFDLVVSMQVLEHVRDLPASIENLWTYLKPGGTLVAHLSGAFGFFGLAGRVVPTKAAAILLEKVQGRPREDTFPAYYHRCWASALERLGDGWSSFEVTPRHLGADYLRRSKVAQAGYLAYEEWSVRHPNLAGYYLIVGTR